MKEFLQELGLLLYKYDMEIHQTTDGFYICNAEEDLNEADYRPLTYVYIRSLLREWED
jgi:hypothetical protein